VDNYSKSVDNSIKPRLQPVDNYVKPSHISSGIDLSGYLAYGAVWL